MFGRYKKRFAAYVGNENKKKFLASLPSLIENVPANKVELDVVSFSGSKYIADQLYSILSFQYNVGRPISWTIYNDGSYTLSEKELLQNIPSVKIEEIDMSRVSETMASACSRFPTLKKMVIFQNTFPQRTTLLVDSDIVFYPGFASEIKTFRNNNWYIVDESSQYFDADFIASNQEIKNPLNLGFLVLNTAPDWKVAFDYIEQKIADKSHHYWSDQTATHILATQQNFKPLDKNRFINSGYDSFHLSHYPNYGQIALRHFVGPVRHKMWQYSWKKVLAGK